MINIKKLRKKRRRIKQSWKLKIHRVSLPFRVIKLGLEQIRQGRFPWVDVQLLKCESFIERRLYNRLWLEGYKMRTQEPCGRYRIDIAIPKYRIAIECDGQEWHSAPEQKAHDRKKDRFLRKHGWTVIRFSGKRIVRRLESCVDRVNTEVSKKRKGWLRR
jgi:very-short-patch-repair endonuclease